MKHIALPAVLALTCVSALLGTISAYAQSQTGKLEIGGSRYPLTAPAAISFPAFFIPETGTEKIYTILDPVSPENRLSVYDSLTSAGFSVHFSISDLESPDGKDIDYRNISVVTLSEHGTWVDATEPFNNPPGSLNVTPTSISPLAACNDWQSSNGDTPATMDAKCGGVMDAIPPPGQLNPTKFYETTAPLSSTLAALATPDSTTIEVADGSLFILPPPGDIYKVRIGNDLATYTGITGNTLTGVTGIDETHFPGEPVTHHPLESGQLTIMQNLSAADTGLYSVGLAMRLVIDASFKQGDYSGTLTITFS